MATTANQAIRVRRNRSKLARLRRNRSAKTRLFNRYHAFKTRLIYYIRVGRAYRAPSRWWLKHP